MIIITKYYRAPEKTQKQLLNILKRIRDLSFYEAAEESNNIASKVFRPRFGCVVGLIYGHIYKLGWSSYNTEKEVIPANKKRAREIACARAQCGTNIRIPDYLLDTYGSIIIRCEEYIKNMKMKEVINEQNAHNNNKGE